MREAWGTSAIRSSRKTSLQAPLHEKKEGIRTGAFGLEGLDLQHERARRPLDHVDNFDLRECLSGDTIKRQQLAGREGKAE